MSKRAEVPPPPEIVDRILNAAGPNLVLVGGQALAYWINYYNIGESQFQEGAITRDIDFLAESPTDKESVERLAHAMGGQSLITPQREMSALIGQAIKILDAESMWNVDVIFKVFKSDARMVRDECADVALSSGAMLHVMNPLHVLKSRMDNLYGLCEKQTPFGENQLRLAIKVVQSFQIECAMRGDLKNIRRAVNCVARWALRTDAGKKIAARRGIYVADAIIPNLFPCEAFHRIHLPIIMRAMSPEKRAAGNIQS